MGMEIFWTLPAPRSRGRAVGPAPLTDLRTGQFNDYDHVFHVARAAEVAGLDGLVIPWDAAADDPWIAASALARHTHRLVLVPELEIPFATPVYLAKMSVSFQRLAQRRLGWAFNFDRSERVRRAHGDGLGGYAWYARADEYLHVAKGVWTERPYNYRGQFYDVEAGGFDGPLAGLPLPTIHSSGESEQAFELAAKHADVHVLSGGPNLGARASRLKNAAEARGRQLKVAARLRVLARHTAEEAVREAGGSELDLVGSHERVAEALVEHAELGIETFIVETRAPLEEAYRFGEHVSPLLLERAAQASKAAASPGGP